MTTLEEIMATSAPDQDAAVSFSRKLLADWMRRNVILGMNMKQALWTFSRIENFSLSLPWGEQRIDLFKLFHTGATASLYFCLRQVDPDDMSQTYHWCSAENLAWLTTRLREYLGEEYATAIETLGIEAP